MPRYGGQGGEDPFQSSGGLLPYPAAQQRHAAERGYESCHVPSEARRAR